MKVKKLNKLLISALLVISLIFRPFFGVSALAEAEIEPTPTPENTAIATETQEATVTNDNQAVVDNNVDAFANTGDNTVGLEVTPTPSTALGAGTSSEPTVTPTLNTEIADLGLTPTPTLIPDNLTVAEEEEIVVVENDNQAEVDNTATVSATTGDNTAGGNGTTIDTGEATAEMDAVNVVNTNITGSNFEEVILNVDENTTGNVDLSGVEIADGSSSESTDVLALNANTADGSVNLTLADFLSMLAVYNTNDATLINTLQLLASSGGNQIVGPNGEILTGDALASLNLFNLVNTNLTGQDWFFGIINLLGNFEGDIILPYEWQFLGEEGFSADGQILALNQSGGEGSQNQASADFSSSTEINNFNQAELTNHVTVEANSGNNQIVGTGSIDTGNADAQANLINFVNTNITGSRWLLLVINIFGDWQGELEGWWGDVQMVPGTIFAWVKLPDLASGSSGSTLAINQDTGDGSVNTAVAGQANSLLVNNSNSASVVNNIGVGANTGENQIYGRNGSINTGDAQASADILNVVNTNITGNNWYFGMINIFDNFLGNIIFPRPDLTVVKTADKSEVLPGEEITYTLTYKNQGRVWASNTIITDTLPAGTTFISATDGGVNQDGLVVWNLGKVYPGQSGTVSVTVKVNSDTAADTKLVNHVSIGTSTCEANKDNNSSSAETLVMAKATPTPQPSQPGGVGGATGEGGGGGGPSTGGCSDTVPGGAPVLLSAVGGDNRVTLTWSKAPDPVSYYLVAYGLSSGNYSFGNPNVGGAETTSYTINDLSGGTTYYFVVRAGNGCTPGPYSNELAVAPTGEPLGGFLPGVLGVKAAEGELGEASSTGGEVAGAQAKGNCPWWLFLSLANLGVVGGYFWLLKSRERRFWWLLPIATAGLTYFGDHFIAHQFYQASRWCDWMWLWSALGSALPFLAKKFFSVFIT